MFLSSALRLDPGEMAQWRQRQQYRQPQLHRTISSIADYTC